MPYHSSPGNGRGRRRRSVQMMAEEPVPTGEAAERESESFSEALPLYLQEIGRVPLLTGAAEVELAKAIEAGNEAADRLKDGAYRTADDLERLADIIDRGGEARRRLVESNLRLVVSVARRYMNRGIALGDLIQEGNIGLMRAVEKFDYRRGFKFSKIGRASCREREKMLGVAA